MRISKNQLQDIINEEIASALLRTENHRLVEARRAPRGTTPSRGTIYAADAASLIAFAKAYSRLLEDAQEQLDDLIEFQEDADVNHSSVDLMERHLRGMNREIDEALDAWYEGVEDALSDDDDEPGVSYEPPRKPRKLR